MKPNYNKHFKIQLAKKNNHSIKEEILLIGSLLFLQQLTLTKIQGMFRNQYKNILNQMLTRL